MCVLKNQKNDVTQRDTCNSSTFFYSINAYENIHESEKVFSIPNSSIPRISQWQANPRLLITYMYTKTRQPSGASSLDNNMPTYYPIGHTG